MNSRLYILKNKPPPVVVDKNAVTRVTDGCLEGSLKFKFCYFHKFTKKVIEFS